MFKTKYLIRLDDACPTLNREKWGKVEEILDKYGVKPMVGIVPDCKDNNLTIDDINPNFWDKALNWQKKGWAIALHGYDHCYISDNGLNGMNPVWKRSEFAGVVYETQKDKIKKGVGVLKRHGITVKYFFAPSHTFDENTLKALRNESEIRIISDMYTLKPYREGDFVYIPCQLGHPQVMKIPGTYTICLHPNNMEEKDMVALDSFLIMNSKSVMAFSDIDTEKVGRIRLIDRLVRWAYFKNRNISVNR